jgi:hypothetical protein
MKAYLEINALKRPSDDISQPRIEDDARSVLEIVDRIQRGEDVLVGSPVLSFENEADPDQRFAIWSATSNIWPNRGWFNRKTC